jgi:hypothetical protein
VILDQAINDCSEDFGSGTGTIINILIQNNRNNDQQTDKEMETVANSLIQNNGNSNQHSDPKREQ